MIKGRDLILSVAISCGFFLGGYYLSAWRADASCAKSIMEVGDNRNLSEAAECAEFLNRIDAEQLTALRKQLLYLMDAKLMCIQLDTTRGGSDSLDRRRLEVDVWQQRLKQIKACAVRKNRPKTARRAENILRWLAEGGVSSGRIHDK